MSVSSNLHPSGFDELMPKTLATATVDRLMHHAHVCQTSGDSIRLTQGLTPAGPAEAAPGPTSRSCAGYHLGELVTPEYDGLPVSPVSSA